MIENDLFWNGFGNGYEGTSLRVWSRLVPHAGVIVDVGANTGIYTLVANCLNPTATVLAMEPVERVFQRLHHNTVWNGANVTLQQMAVSDTTGMAWFYDLSSDHELTASLDPSMTESRGDVVTYKVATKRLDKVLSDAALSSVDLVKIDVELSEPQVLRGMGSYLSGSRPTLLIEILNDRVAQDVSDITRGLEYNIFRIVEHSGLVRTDCIQATELKERNYLLIQNRIMKDANICDFLVE
jgi:FkbM family methyltransferase